MAEIPTAEAFGARQVPRLQPEVRQAPTGRGQALAGTGQALKGLGRAIAKFAAEDVDTAERRRAYNTQTDWMSFNTQVDADYSNFSQEEYDSNAGAFDFADRAAERFDTFAKPFMERLGPDAKPEDVNRWQTVLDQKRFEIYSTAREFQKTEQRRYYQTSIQDVTNQALFEVDKNPDSFGKWNQLVLQNIEASGLNERDKNTLRRKLPEVFVSQTVQSLIAQRRFTDANDILESFAEGSDANGQASSSNNPIVTRIAKIGEEGAGIKSSVNDGGTARIGDTRWLSLLEDYRPDIIEAYRNDEAGLLALRDEQDLVLELLSDEAERNSKELDKLDIDPTPGNLYLASIFGVNREGGIQEILDADGGELLSAVLPNDVYAQNIDLFEGKDVSWLKKYASDQMVAKGGPENKVTGESRLFTGPGFVNDLRSKISTAENDYVSAVSTKRKGQFERAIAIDPFAVSREDILADSSMKPGVQAALINKLDKAQKDANKIRNVFERIELAPNLIDPTNKNDRKGVDAYYEKQLEETRGIYASLNEEFTNQDALNVAVDVTRKSGIAPPALVSQIRTGVLSKDKERFAAAGELADNLFQASPTAFLGQTSAKQMQDAAIDWRYAREHLNMSPDEAAEFLQPIYDPTRTEERKALDESLKTIFKDTKFSEVQKSFDNDYLGDTKWLSLQVGRGTEGDENLFMRDWQRLYRINYYATFGSEELAMARTAKDMGRIYGQTTLGAPGADVVRYPIEGQYPQYDPSVIKTEMIENTRAVMGDAAPADEDIFVVQTDVTRDDIRRGRKARYSLMYRKLDEDTGQYIFNPVPGQGEFIMPDKDTPEFLETQERAFRRTQFEQRFVENVSEDKDVLYDRNAMRFVRRNEDGSFDTLYSIDKTEASQIKPEYSLLVNAASRKPSKQEEQTRSRVGMRKYIESLETPPRPLGTETIPEFERTPRPLGVETIPDYERTPRPLDTATIPEFEREPRPLGTETLPQPKPLDTEIIPEDLRAQAVEFDPRVNIAQMLYSDETGRAPIKKDTSKHAPSFKGVGLSGRIISAESGGRATAKNPLSSAFGAGQFINSTWLSMIKKYRPDLERGRSRKEVLDLRSDPALSAEMVDRYAEENAQVLRRNALPVTAANVYMLHFLGPAQGRTVLKASDGTRLERLLAKSTIRANPFLRGKTVGYLKKWAYRKMG